MEFLVGLIPIILFLILLAVLKKSALFSTYASLIVAIILNFVMSSWRIPVQGIIASLFEGFAVAWMPIGFVIIAAIFAYDLSVKNGKIEIIKTMLGNITSDRRAQALILAWGFGGFIEGIAGYGTAVAIPAAIMISLGFSPMTAAMICLIANSTPTAFGTVGLPVTTMISNFGLNPQQTALYTSLLLLILTCIIPFILVVFANKEIDGGKNPAFGKGILPVVIASIIGYMVQPLIAMTTGAELPTIISSLIAMILMIVATKMFVKAEEGFETVAVSTKDAILAWLPYILMVVLIVGTSPVVKVINEPLHDHTISTIDFSFGHWATWFRDAKSAKEAGVAFKWILAPAAPLFIATVIAGFIQKVKVKDMVEVLGHTIYHKLDKMLVIMGIVALSVVMKHSGMTASIADGLKTLTGSGFPFIAPFLGTIGTFVTGSDLSSNLLFGGIQVGVAKGLSQNPALQSLLIAANTAGATGGKMISPQNIAIVTSVSAALNGKDGELLGKTIKYSVLYGLVLGVLTFVGAGMIH